MIKYFLILLFFVTAAQADKLSIVKQWSLPSDYKINKKRVGGLSGCSYYDNKLYFVSDDRGREGGPRVFTFAYDEKLQKIDFNKFEVIVIQTDKQNKILDLEGISVLSKEKFLLSSEGDLNQKPRIMPDLFWANSVGKKLTSIKISDEFLPELSGLQSKGVQNNLAFEGLSIDVDQKKWAAMLEGSLLQDDQNLKLIESNLDSDKFDAIYTYPIPTIYSSSDKQSEGLVGYFGVSEILFNQTNSYLVLERGVKLTAGGINYLTQICHATKPVTGQQLARQCFYSMNDDVQLKQLIPNGANFEGLCWVNKQKKQFIAVSDNNFSKSEKTVFILYQLN